MSSSLRKGSIAESPEMASKHASGKKEKKPRSRGRPAQLSRAQILQAAFDLLDSQPLEHVTMTGLARAMGLAPMSLYTHVQNREDLLDGVSELVMDNLQLHIPDGADWPEQVTAWIHCVHQHLVNYPQVVKLLGQSSSIPPSWLRCQTALIRLLRKAGLSGRALSDATRWLSRSVIGSVMFDLIRHEQFGERFPEERMLHSLALLAEEDRREMEDVIHHGQGYDSKALFQFTVDRLLQSLQRYVDERASYQEFHQGENQ